MRLLGLSQRTVGHHVLVAMALLVVIPTLIAGLYIVRADRFWHGLVAQNPYPLMTVAVFWLAGAMVAVRCAASIRRLKKSLEEMLAGDLPEQVQLLKTMDDMHAIERALNILLEHYHQTNEALRREAQERVAAEALKDDFVGTVSHELRTPLSVIREGVTLLVDQIPGAVNDVQKKVLLTLQSNVERLSRLVNDLLELSRIEAGRLLLHRSRVDLRTVAQEIAAAFRPVAQKKGVTVEIETPGERIEVYGDRDRLAQVLTNLVSNAVKFTDKGCVVIRLSSFDHLVRCEVEDTGSGIDPADIPRLFQKFVQINRRDGAGHQGTGLGLVIAKSLVELHGGFIRVESKVGCGTRVWFVLPQYSEEEALRGRVDDALQVAAIAGRQIGLFLITLHVDGPRRPDLISRFANADLLAQTRGTGLIRGSDIAFHRGPLQAVVAVDIEPKDVPIMLARWRRILEEVFEAGRGGVTVTFGHAWWPTEGSCAAELLAIAEQRQGRIADVVPTGTPPSDGREGKT